MKTLKWNFNQPRKEHVEQLHDQLQPCVSATLFSQLFHDDFKKHIEALGTLTKVRRRGGRGGGKEERRDGGRGGGKEERRDGEEGERKDREEEEGREGREED